MHKILLIILSFSIFLLTGCSPRVQVSINSIGNQPQHYQSYTLMSGMKNINPDDLQHQEYVRYINKALQSKGLKPTTFADADMVIFLYYGISEPSQENYNYSMPVYGQTGVSSSYTSGTINSFGNMATYSGTTTYTPTYGVVGSQTYSGTRTYFTRHVILDAVDAQRFKDTQEVKSLWKTTIISKGSSGDLRTIFPILMGAGQEYIGTNTGKAIEITLPEDDDRVLAIKAIQ